MEQKIKNFEQLYNATYNKVVAYVLAKCGKISEVEDILQEVYSELLKVLLQNETNYIKSPEAFVLQLAKSKVYRYYSDKEQQKVCEYVENPEEVDSLLDEQNADWEDALIDKLTAREVMEYISGKDELTREIFYQHYFEDRTLKEIAESCGVKESTVKNRLYRTLKELSGLKKLLCILAVLLLAALLVKPVYILAEDVISRIKRYLTEDTQNTLEIIALGSSYRDYKERIERGELPADIHININGEDYTIEKLEEIWVSNPWLEELDWDNEIESATDEIDYYVVIHEDGNMKNEAVEGEVGETTVEPTKTPDK